MFKKLWLTGCLIRRRLTALRLKTFSMRFSFRFSAMSVTSNKSKRLMFFIGVSFVVFVGSLPVHVRGLGENEQVIDDFDTGTANYWQGFKNNDSATFWHLRMHDEPRPPGINLLRPPSKDGDGFIEVFPVSDSPAQIFSNVFDLFPGATVEITYWNFVATYPSVRKSVLLLYKVLIDGVTGTRPPLQAVLIYSAPISNDPSLDWITVPIDLKITEPSKIQVRYRITSLRSNSIFFLPYVSFNIIISTFILVLRSSVLMALS
jgi:hypothetical protein